MATISDCYIQCSSSFSRLTKSLGTSTSDADDGIPLKGIANEYSRFDVWAGSVGAKHSPHKRISLDYRLRDSSFYAARVVDMLQRLDSTLKTAEDLIIGKRPLVEVAQPKFDRQRDNDSDQSSVSSSAESSSSDEADMLTPERQIVALYESITNSVRHLYSLAMVIRQPVATDRLSRASKITVDHFVSFDQRHVDECFPDASLVLKKRLAKAITRRRQLLIYNEKHYRKSSEPQPSEETRVAGHTVQDEPREKAKEDMPPLPVTSDPIKHLVRDTPSYAPTISKGSLLASTEATKFIPPVDMREEPDVQSESGTITTFGFTGKDSVGIRVPPRPQDDNGEVLDQFLCPLCYHLIEVKGERAWMRHVFRDLQAYVCTFDDCETPDILFETRQDWLRHELENHRREWHCNDPKHKPHKSEPEFIEHMKTFHELQIPGPQLLSFAKLCERSSSVDAVACPLCRDGCHDVVNGFECYKPSWVIRQVADYSYSESFNNEKSDITKLPEKDFNTITDNILTKVIPWLISLPNDFTTDGNPTPDSTEEPHQSLPTTGPCIILSGDLKRHVGQHLERLALFALKRSKLMPDDGNSAHTEAAVARSETSFESSQSADSGAVEALSNDASRRANYLSNLGNRLGRRYQQTGSKKYLDRAISAAERSLEVPSQDAEHRAASLNALGMWLGERSDRTGSMSDIDRAVQTTGMAIEAFPLEHPERVNCLVNLGKILVRRFELTGSVSDLDRAIEVFDAGRELLPSDSPSQTSCLNNLAIGLSRRFDCVQLVQDLDRAIQVAELACKVIPRDHHELAVCWGTLGVCLGQRFDMTASMDDLNRAIEANEMAVSVTPLEYMDRASYLNNIGCYLRKRYEMSGSVDDLESSLRYFTEGWHCLGTPTSIRIRLALGAAEIYAWQLNWEQSSQLLERAVELLPAVSPRSSSHNDKEHMLADFVGLASTAAAVALNAGKDAYHSLKLLEMGRDIVTNLLMDMQGDISNLKQIHPGLADEFISLRDELDSPADRPYFSVPSNDANSFKQANRRHEADQRFTELIAKIRAQPGFERFFLPPTADEMMAAASLGPIIIVNLSPYRCDAFLVQLDRVSVVELPELTLKEAQRRANELHSRHPVRFYNPESLVEWLWDVICRPCLGALGFEDPPSDDNWPRVWWIPTRHLGRLPLHAAGYHRAAASPSDSVMDRVMSTYASSIKALIYGRRHNVRGHDTAEPESALLIAMRDTPGLSTLPFAVEEVDMLAALCPSLGLKPTMPPRCRDEVLQHLKSCKIFHFAGHGVSDPGDPSRSCLLLEDWKINPLMAGTLRDHGLRDNPPFFAYLSDCSTGDSKSKMLTGEGVHLVHAFQLAGFRHVVGTLWGISDRHSVHVARVLYETMQHEGVTDQAVCCGLHRAVRALRDGQSEMNEALREQVAKIGDTSYYEEDTGLFYWAPYVHFGV